MRADFYVRVERGSAEAAVGFSHWVARVAAVTFWKKKEAKKVRWPANEVRLLFEAVVIWRTARSDGAPEGEAQKNN